MGQKRSYFKRLYISMYKRKKEEDKIFGANNDIHIIGSRLEIVSHPNIV